METMTLRERRSQTPTSSIACPPDQKRSPPLSVILPELCYSRKKKQYYGFWALVDIMLLLSSFGLMYILQDAGYSSLYIYFPICCIAAVFLLSAVINFYMFFKFRKEYNLAYASATAEEFDRLPSEIDVVKKRSEQLRSRFFKKRPNELPRETYASYKHDITEFRLPKQRSRYPYEGSLSPSFLPKEEYSLEVSEIKNESTLSLDLTSGSETSLDKTWPPMMDSQIPIPNIYPLFNRRRSKYFLTEVDETRQLIKDFRKAIVENPVAFSFHEGQIEKYTRLLSAPKDSGYRDVKEMWQRLSYQISTIVVKDNLNIEDSYVLPINHEVWRRFKMNPKSFVNWVANFRIWVARTLLHKIVEEIDSINNKLKTIVPTVSVGNVGLDDLISTARNTMVTMNVPSLTVLLPYLQISTNQKYIVQRLRDLSFGNTMSDFSWNSGGKVDDKHWEPHLPCDAELIMHLIVTYLDSRMPISIESPDRKPFSSCYFAKHPDPPPSSDIVIYQQSTSPPHYQLIIKNEMIQLPSGAYNMFFAILIFLQYIKTYHNGVVGRMFLGQSGVNVLWTMEEVNMKTFS